MRRKWWIVILLVVVFIPLAVGFSLWNGLRGINELTFNNSALVNAVDGIHEGEMDAGLVSARVRVEVREGRITDIAILEHENGRGSAAEAITGEIISRQSLAVDTVSGATASSKVILKAVEVALLQSKN